MRGKGCRGLLLVLLLRITPAYAGKRGRGRRAIERLWDHPRVCGEKDFTPSPADFALGSPPRMRGKGTMERKKQSPDRITPAYAGKSPVRVADYRAGEDHPRVCGEKVRAYVKIWNEWGSPPRMRGKDCLLERFFDCFGITPAYAGKRLKRSRSTVPPVAIVPLFPSVCNKPVVSDGSPAGRDAPLFLPAENAVPASPAYNLRSL